MLKLGRVFKTDIFLHPTLIILLLILMYQRATPYYYWMNLIALVSVLLHELGHVRMAQAFHIPTKRIIMTPIGGLAQIQKKNMSPNEEFWITLAGPAVNAFIVILAGCIDYTFPSKWLPNVIIINAVLMVFNLLPIYPMDGGRILRSILADYFHRQIATKITIVIGFGFAISLFIVGIVLGVPSFIIISMFVLLTQYVEYKRINKILQRKARYDH